ncbi:MAG: hypothetical protein KDC69_01075 [Flavobacteriaceae bacterium]|nr:hypothetical protein [Flavobacteriaceae bacterium]
MKPLLAILVGTALLISCKKETSGVQMFRTGTFRTLLEGSTAISTATRNDSLQYETYNGQTDTFDIKWNSNFEYELLNKYPKNELDSTPFVVKITGIKDSTYTFLAHYKGSNFKQKGKAIKLK